MVEKQQKKDTEHELALLLILKRMMNMKKYLIALVLGLVSILVLVPTIVQADNGDYILYIHRKVGFRNLMPIPIMGQEHSQIRLILSQYLSEDTDHFRETIWDGLERFLKL